MKIVILGSALPVRFGHPRQRIAWALRQAVASYADVVSITLDCWFSEWDARRMLLEGDHFFPSIHAKNPKELPFMSMWQKNAISLNPEHLVEEPDPEVFEQGWLNPARKEKILARIAAMDPDLVLISDPLLNGLGHELGQTGANIGWIDDALVDWVSGAAAFLHSSQYSRWMSILSAHFERTRPEALGYAPDRIAHHLHQPRPSRAGPWLHLPVEQEESELFLFKSNTLLVPSTGNWWLDRLILGWVKNWCREKQKMADDTAGLVLVGFPAEAANDLKKECGDEVEIHQDWTRLHTAIGVAQCLFVPFVTPWLQPFIEAALGVGTPVLTSASERATKDLTPQPGLYDVPKNKLVDALLNILGGGFANEETARAISEAAQSHAAVLADGHDIGTILSSWSGKTDLPRHNPPAPQWRRAPVRHDPQVLYNPITKMLLLRMELFSSAMIEEVRLLTDDGHELTRLAPSAHQKTLAHFELEGGLVTDVEILGDALRIACYRDVEEVWAARIPKHDFQYIKCGLASLEINENIADGAYWIDASMNDARQSLLINGRASPLGEDESVLFKDLGVAAVPFRTLIPKEVRGTTRLALGRLSNETGHPEEMPQKALVDNYARLSRAPNPRAELEALRDKHLGQRAWILGNGPSVRLEDLARIPGDDVTFAFNRFYLSYDDQPLRENYVVSADTLMIQDFGQEMIDVASGQPLFCIPPAQVSGLRGSFVQLDAGSSSVPIFSHDPTRFVSVGGSSVFVALQMAWYMGIRDVVLYGMDYSFSATLTRDPRYPFPVAFDEGNHFIKSYRDAKPWCPPTWRDISAGFLNARVAFELSGGQIVNATRGGLLTTFERAEFDRLCGD